MCGVDGTQSLTGCKFGKGNLIHRDWGKHAYTFFRRSAGKAMRIVGRPNAWPRDPEYQELFAKIRCRRGDGDAGAALRGRGAVPTVLRVDPRRRLTVIFRPIGAVDVR